MYNYFRKHQTPILLYTISKGIWSAALLARTIWFGQLKTKVGDSQRVRGMKQRCQRPKGMSLGYL